VLSGNVIITNVTLTTATNSPTVVVTGGNLTMTGDSIQSTGAAQTVVSETAGMLTLQDDTVQSTGAAVTAVSVSGGTADLGTPANPGGNTLDLSAGSAAALIQTSGTGAVSSAGNTSEAGGSVVPSLVLSLTGTPTPSVYGQQVTLT